MNKKQHIIKNIKKRSKAARLGMKPGESVLSINGQEIIDIFDYEYLMQDEKVVLEIADLEGNVRILEVEKDPDDDLGIEFENGLMDEYRSCHNKCIFCFIDQMPKGMRETLYFKDDDSRLSFLQGNYVTLTNMSDYDVERICKYHLSPINISFQTMNPELRCKMLTNRFAGEALKKVDKFMEAGITMNGQIVLCKGVNDGKELDYSISELIKYIPNLESVSVVPVGLTKFREGLYPLEPFTKEDACEVLDLIHKWQDVCMERFGSHFIHASDEWYILAERELPEEDNYDGYPQLENGVGMLRLLMDEFEEGLKEVLESPKLLKKLQKNTLPVSFATGKLAYPYIKRMADKFRKLCPNREIYVYEIENSFFGPMITVSGLITGGDLIDQLSDKPLGQVLYLPQNMLRSGETVFLDDITLEELKKALHVRVDIVKSSGWDMIQTFLNHK